MPLLLVSLAALLTYAQPAWASCDERAARTLAQLERRVTGPLAEEDRELTLLLLTELCGSGSRTYSTADVPSRCGCGDARIRSRASAPRVAGCGRRSAPPPPR